MNKNIKFILVVVIFLIYGCSSTSSSEKYNSLIGNSWTLSEVFGAQCNACPEVVFINTNEGVIIKPSKEERKFKYVLSHDKIKFFSEDEPNYFGATEFNFKVYSKNTFVYCELNSLDEKGNSILIREQN